MSLNENLLFFQAQEFDESHTGQHIAEVLLSMLSSWNIDKSKVHLFIRDNALNMVKAMSDATLPSFGCFAHSLQLVVNDGVLSQRAVTELLSTSRKIVGHFRRSCLAKNRMREIQSNLGLPLHQLIQDEPTRWNSALYMLKRIVEQKMAIGAYAMEYDIPQLSAHQLELANKIIKVLSPVEEITQCVSAGAASVSVIIPFIQILDKSFTENEDDYGIRAMKTEMRRSVKTRFSDIEKNEKLVITTIIDPRFKDKFYISSAVKVDVKTMVKDMITDENDTMEAIAENEPSAKKKYEYSALKMFTKITEEEGITVTANDSLQELDTYLNEPLIPLGESNPYLWWANNKVRFSKLSKIAQKYLGALPTSVASERLFSAAGDVYDEKRSLLAPERAEKLLFIKLNLKL